MIGPRSNQTAQNKAPASRAAGVSSAAAAGAPPSDARSCRRRVIGSPNRTSAWRTSSASISARTRRDRRRYVEASICADRRASQSHRAPSDSSLTNWIRRAQVSCLVKSTALPGICRLKSLVSCRAIARTRGTDVRVLVSVLPSAGLLVQATPETALRRPLPTSPRILAAAASSACPRAPCSAPPRVRTHPEHAGGP